MIQTKTGLTTSYIAILAILLWVIINFIRAIWGVFGPGLEARLFPPVVHLDLVEARCVGADAYVYGSLIKREYIGGRGAEFKGVTIYPVEGGDRLPWKKLEPDDRSPANRPPGPQEWGVYLVGGCGRSVIVHTVHESPITGFRIPGRFGPFTPETG